MTDTSAGNKNKIWAANPLLSCPRYPRVYVAVVLVQRGPKTMKMSRRWLRSQSRSIWPYRWPKSCHSVDVGASGTSPI